MVKETYGNLFDYSHPIEFLKKFAEKLKLDLNSVEFAFKLDESALWPNLRQQFFYPKFKDLPKGNL